MIQSKCPTCEIGINITREPKIGQFITCPHCKEVFEVVAASPFTLESIEFNDNGEVINFNSARRKKGGRRSDDFDEEFEDQLPNSRRKQVNKARKK